MNNPMETVFVVDDDASIRRALFYLLESAGYRAETYASVEEFVARERFDGVGCIVLDLRMPGLSGMELQEKLTQSDCNVMPVIFLTGHGELDIGIEAMKKGAVDFLTKPCDDEKLLEAVSVALAKARRTREDLEETHAVRGRIRHLTLREHEILRHVIAGRLNKQIAAALDIAEDTVKKHRGHIMDKLGVASVAELVRLSEKAGIDPVG
jgi:FixJ family two-component response regulator